MSWIPILFIFSGVFLAALGAPMALGRVRPNSVYGFRVPATLGDPELWYPANRFAGRRMIEAGILITLASAALAFVPGLSADGYTLAGTITLLVVMVVVLVCSLRHLKRLQASRDANRSAGISREETPVSRFQ